MAGVPRACVGPTWPTLVHPKRCFLLWLKGHFGRVSCIGLNGAKLLWLLGLSMRHFILPSTILCATQQFGQDVDVIDNFDINWSSKWLWPIIFSVRVIIQYMHVTCNIWHMTERLPSHNFDWFALLEIGFVPADIWISWFGPFAFVKPSLSHLRVLELECWISPETSFVFSMSNHPHFRTGDIHICQSSLYGWLQSASSKSGSHPLKWGKSN